ncbi:unnamed protein product [Effrenium voratum]|uniref:C2HC/C3H-type domain-containing protein n=1 Tax=Effrenium voratum TaxID=2562239 RepID=A0AA36I6N9_9DINO|nr:unnamed protein product [Effrenium voratum]CAJ1382032.1 unnamed protein product [Effrenium voratum]
MRPPSREDVQTAQSHLVLLKSKMRQRRQEPRTEESRFKASERPPRAASSLRGVTWDPPSAVQGQVSPQVSAVQGKPERLEEGYPRISPQGGAIDGLLDDGPLVPCPDCGRSFKAESLEKHKKICKKVFQQKRKQFNSAANRLGEFDNANELIANATKVEKKEPEKAAKQKDKTVPKWKAQSLAFRQAILAAKGTSDPEAAKKAAELQKELNAANLASGGNALEADMVKCPHCGRTFNQEAGQRHIAICLKTFGGKGRQAQSSRGKPGTPSDARGASVRGPSASRKGQTSSRRTSLSQASVGSRMR